MGGVTLCHVAALAKLVARVRRYEPGELKWQDRNQRPINLVATGGRFATVTAGQILHHLRAAAPQYGKDRLGFLISKIGTHSLHTGAATAMFLAGVPAETIKLIGRWRSQTFLRYIRIQVQQLMRGVTTEMMTNPEFLPLGQD